MTKVSSSNFPRSSIESWLNLFSPSSILLLMSACRTFIRNYCKGNYRKTSFLFHVVLTHWLYSQILNCFDTCMTWSFDLEQRRIRVFREQLKFELGTLSTKMKPTSQRKIKVDKELISKRRPGKIDKTNCYICCFRWRKESLHKCVRTQNLENGGFDAYQDPFLTKEVRSSNTQVATILHL